MGIVDELKVKFNMSESRRRFHVGMDVAFWKAGGLGTVNFIPNPENKPEVNHKFGNKLDCSAKNLEWSTSKENRQHALKFGLKSADAKSPNAKLTAAEAEYCRKFYIPRDKEYGVRAPARKFNINHKKQFPK